MGSNQQDFNNLAFMPSSLDSHGTIDIPYDMDDTINIFHNYRLIDWQSVTFVNQLEEGFTCKICKSLLKHPVQSSCGHRFCQGCIKKDLQRGSKHWQCPVDDTDLTVNDVNPDRFCIRQIMKQECFCPNKERGCMWTGAVVSLSDHQRECSH